MKQYQPSFTAALPIIISEKDVPVTFGLFTEPNHCENVCEFSSDRCWFKRNFFFRLSVSKNYNSYIVSNVTLSFNLANKSMPIN